MTDQEGKRSKRSGIAARFDEDTLAAFTVLLLVTVAAVFTVGMATAEERISCGLNDMINHLLAYLSHAGDHASSTSFRASARSSRIRFRNSIVSRDRPPWTRPTVRTRSRPAGVLAPVEAPPCIRQRPFRIGRFRQGEPPRVLAPQAGRAVSSVTAWHERFRDGAGSLTFRCMGWPVPFGIVTPPPPGHRR